MNEYEVVGKGRTVLPLGRFAFYTLAPMIVLYVLATIPTHILGTRIKQVVSFPLMICLVATPYLYRDENDGNNYEVYLLFTVLLICLKTCFVYFVKHYPSPRSKGLATSFGFIHFCIKRTHIYLHLTLIRSYILALDMARKTKKIKKRR